MDRPLTGLRILDFSRLLPGPYCTHVLAEMGAEVTKVEDTVHGDLMRLMPPLVQGTGVSFVALNRGKRSIALDLKQAGAQTIAQRLAASSDVVIESFRPGVTERLGIDFPTLSVSNQRLVYCSITGYGHDPEVRDLAGHDLTYAAMSGLLDALSPGAPRTPGVQLVDSATTFMAAVRILAALQARERGPQLVQVSLVESAQALMPVNLAEAVVPAGDQPSLGDLLKGSPRNDLYQCRDGAWIAVSPLEEHFWRRFCDLLQRHEYLDEGAVPSGDDLRRIFATRDAQQWFEILSSAGVPCAPVRAVRDVVNRDLTAGSAPILGQHTGAILGELGYSTDEIERLSADGIVRGG